MFFNTSSNLIWSFKSFCFPQISIGFTFWSKEITTTALLYVANDYKSRRTVVGSNNFFILKVYINHIKIPQSHLNGGKNHQNYVHCQLQKDKQFLFCLLYLFHRSRYIYPARVRHYVHRYHCSAGKFV